MTNPPVSCSFQTSRMLTSHVGPYLHSFCILVTDTFTDIGIRSNHTVHSWLPPYLPKTKSTGRYLQSFFWFFSNFCNAAYTCMALQNSLIKVDIELLCPPFFAKTYSCHYFISFLNLVVDPPLPWNILQCHIMPTLLHLERLKNIWENHH